MNETKICIYCMGEYGIQTYYKLKDSGIRIACFGDRDRKKDGYAFDGLYCVSYEEVLKFDREKTIIIVAFKYSKELIQIFEDMGFKNVYDKERAIELFCGEKKITRTPLTDIEEIRQLKNLIANCLYNKVIKEDLSSINRRCTEMLSDFLKRNSDNAI